MSLEQFDHTTTQAGAATGAGRAISTVLVGGMVASLAIIAWIALEGPGAAILRWCALIPALLGVFLHRMQAQARQLAVPQTALAEELQHANTALRQQVEDLIKLRDIMLGLGATFERGEILDELTHAVTDLIQFERGLVLLTDEEREALVFGAYSHAAPDPDSHYMLEQVRFDLEDLGHDPLMSYWQAGESVLVKDPAVYLRSRFNWIMTTLSMQLFYSVPLMVGGQFRGVIIVDNSPTRLPITKEQQGLLDALAAHIAINLENARLYQLTDEQLGERVQELQILTRIDRELNETLDVERVLILTLDWALRFTGSQTAAVAIIEPDGETMRFISGYGYAPDQWEQLTQTTSGACGITGRVARTGEPVLIGDVSTEPDYLDIVPGIRSQMSAPVKRRGRVVAVITVQSNRTNAFTAENLEFVQRLAARAATAIENSRLLEETQRERRKLALILATTADAVIVVDDDNQLVLVNQAALAAYNLPPREQYEGRTFQSVFSDSPLIALYQRARSMEQALVEEMRLPQGRVFHVNLARNEQVGWIIVSHDITPFKETDKLKNELLATTSHDLKNPLGSILGYVDLIKMTNDLNQQGEEYAKRVHNAVHHMRDLIDDLLDMARIESGIQLERTSISLHGMVLHILDRYDLDIRKKEMVIELNFPPDLPPVSADETRLEQIVGNLISNAIKYTPPSGTVTIRGERRSGYVYVAVQDSGIGISPEDQAQVFQRFYRVRGPETDHIEGTGLGLAIVKSLVEAHGGQMGLESRLGEGSMFFFTLPTEDALNGNQPPPELAAQPDSSETAGAPLPDES